LIKEELSEFLKAYKGIVNFEILGDSLIVLREASKIKNRLNLGHCPNRGREVSAS
jgi:hypothetical protein